MASPSSSPSPSAPQPRRPHEHQQPPQRQRAERGVPDGAVVGLLAVLLGTTALVWAATELGGLVSHGRFPRPLPFLNTAGAIRHLATAPNDLPGAWPGTPTAALPSAAAFWLTFFALLSVALMLLLSAATARAKRRVAHPPAPAGTGATAGPSAGPSSGAIGGPVTPAGSAGAVGPVGSFGPGVAAGPGVPLGPGGPAGPGGPVGPGVPVGPPGQRRAPGRPGADGVPSVSTPPTTVPHPGGSNGSTPAAGRSGTAQPWARPGDPTDPDLLDGRAAWQLRNGVDLAAGPLTGSAYPLVADSADSAYTADTAPTAGSVPRPAGATASGWARGAARAEHSAATHRFTLPPSGTMCVFAPEAGSAARRALVAAVVAEAAAVPLVVVSADATVWDARPPHRRAVRFDPQHVTEEDTEEPRGRWAPHTGCTEPVVATARARALLLPTTRPVADRAEQDARALAETLLRCWLRAAALGGRPFRHVARWATGGSGAGRQEAVAVLQSAATPTDVAAGEEAWAGQLQAALLQPAAILDEALARLRAALASVAELHVLAACTPESAASALDPTALLHDGAAGSLYILGRAGDGRLREPGTGAAPAVHSAMPLLSALVDDVVQRAWHATAHSGSDRSGAPPLLILDDVAAVAPFPTLPQLMADGGARGLRAVTLLRSPEQARARWGERSIHSLWTTADHRAVLGPLSPAPLAALLASVGAAEHAPQPGLAEDELLVLPGHRQADPAQRFRITPAGP